jgi:hypothetical protein
MKTSKIYKYLNIQPRGIFKYLPFDVNQAKKPPGGGEICGSDRGVLLFLGFGRLVDRGFGVAFDRVLLNEFATYRTAATFASCCHGCSFL